MRVFIKFIPFLVILIFSLFASQKLFNPLFYTTHDGEGHVIRMIEFDKSFHDGQIPVRLAGRINHGLSYPFFNFNYPLIYYLALLVHFLGLSYVTVFKIILIASTILGGIGMYLYSKRLYKILPSLTAAIFYIYAPYRFLNMYVRGDVAEAFALGVFPFLFFAVERLLTAKKGGITLLILIFSVLILSHNITAFIGLPLCILYFSFRVLKKKKKKIYIKKIFISFLFSILLTSFFWLPVFLESGLTKLIELTEDYIHFFPGISEVIYSPWGFGPYVQGYVPGKMSPQTGVVHVAILVFGIFVLILRYFKKRFTDNDAVSSFFLAVTFIFFFLTSSFSIFLWDHIYFLKLIQLPWRLVGYIVFSASITAGYLMDCIKHVKIALILFTFLALILLYANRNLVRVNMYVQFYNPFENSLTYGGSTTSKDEHMPRLAPRIFSDPNSDGDLIASTSGTAKRTIWRSNYHVFMLNLHQNAEFRDNTSYFPGWQAKIDGKTATILYSKDDFYRLRLAVPKGKHVVEFRFGETWYRGMVDYISIITFAGIVAFSLYKKKIF